MKGKILLKWRPVLLTNRGRGVAVVQSVGDYEKAEEERIWYTEQGVSDVGTRWVAEVFQRVQALADHPDMGRIVPEFDQLFLQELIHPSFRVVYRRDSQRGRIVRVWRSERQLHLPMANHEEPSRT